MMRNPFAYRWCSDEFHGAALAASFGGYYPERGQLQRCAQGYFDLVEEVDGTEDYLIYSQWVTNQFAQPLRTRRGIWNALKSRCRCWCAYRANTSR